MPAPLVGLLTGNPTVDKAKLDAWAAEHTDDLIREMPVDLDGDMMLVLASALLLRTTWVRPFTEQVRRVPAGPWARFVALARAHGPRPGFGTAVRRR